jgi:uncharacterized protein (PEP-CTERM system associated)
VRAGGVSRKALGWFAARSALVLAAMLASTPARAQNWEVTPYVGVRETYTTNATLAPSGFERDSFVTTLTGGITVNGAGARTRLNGNVALQGVLYSGSGLSENNQLFPQASLLGSIEAIENFFFVEGAVNVSQTYLSPFGAQPATNVGVTDNRYTSSSARVSPYIQGVLPGEISYLLRNDNIWSNLSNTPTNAPGFVGSYVNRWIGRLASPIRTFGWSLDGNTTYTKFTDEQSLTNEIVRGLLHYQPDPQLRLDAIGGYEWNDYFITKSDNAVYGAGGEWRPTDRTLVAGNWQYRFFGSSYDALLTHRNPFTAFNINASRNITTFPQLLFALPAGGNVAGLVDAAFTTRIPDPVERAQAVEAFLAQTGLPATLQSPLNFYTQQVQLYEQQSATFTWLGVRNSLAFTVYNRKNEVISGGSGQPLPPPFGQQNNNTQRGASLVFNHRLTPLTNLNALATRYDTTATAPFTGKSTTNTFLVGMGTRLSPKTDAATGLTYTTSDSNLFNDYDVFTAYVGLNHRF